ncbi:hypothetical protein AURDEDRAFT_171067 [Auricularia subglabra TFB-10046 SS5]|nr:hypothetical protein AURDEDRAFT_171067 [Auricularia subglabra TFB-10046 SS5]
MSILPIRRWTAVDSLDFVPHVAESYHVLNRSDRHETPDPGDAHHGIISKNDPVLVLPTELLNDCFRQLDFDDRLTVSHVSRAWRRIALCDPLLWNHTTTLGRYRRANAAKLRELLIRSDPWPFSVTAASSFAFPSIPRKFFRVLLIHMHRMEHLTLLSLPSEMIQVLFGYDAPILRSFIWGAGGEKCSLPMGWGLKHAPVLETLCLKPFSVPDEIEPLAAVRKFYGQLGGLSDGRKALSTVFPSLETLHITSITQNELPYLSDLPASMKDLSFETDIDLPFDTVIDYAPVMRACQFLNLERLFVERAKDCLDALHAFTTVIRGTWELRISTYDNNVVNMRACAEQANYTIRCHRPVSLSRQPRITAYLQHVSRLSVSVDLLGELTDLTSWERYLPHLCHLEIYFWDSLPLPGRAASTTSRPIVAPGLDEIWLFVNGALDREYRWILERFPALLPTFFAYTKSQLASITITEFAFSSFKRSDLVGLMSLAEHVWVQSEDTRELRGFSFSEVFPAEPE